MMRRIAALALFLLLAAPAFADAPPPPPPAVTVHLVSSGQPVTGIAQIAYHCTEGGDSVYETLGCSGGTCANSPPQVSRSYCAYYPDGYFSYYFQGRNMTSQEFNNTHSLGSYYEFTLDAGTGALTEAPVTPQPSPYGCWPFSALVLAIAAFLGRK